MLTGESIRIKSVELDSLILENLPFILIIVYLTVDGDDTRGLCARGKILEFETLQNGRSVKRL